MDHIWQNRNFIAGYALQLNPLSHNFQRVSCTRSAWCKVEEKSRLLRISIILLEIGYDGT